MGSTKTAHITNRFQQHLPCSFHALGPRDPEKHPKYTNWFYLQLGEKSRKNNRKLQNESLGKRMHSDTHGSQKEVRHQQMRARQDSERQAGPGSSPPYIRPDHHPPFSQVTVN